MVRSLSAETKNAKPTAFHHLIATLAQEGRLMRLYTQNVDGIDTSMDPLKTEARLPIYGFSRLPAFVMPSHDERQTPGSRDASH